MSRDRALELARAECDRRGLKWTEPARVHWGVFSYTVWTNVGSRGGNVWVVIDKCDGRVRKVDVTPM